jgi:hypothetical protein
MKGGSADGVANGLVYHAFGGKLFFHDMQDPTLKSNFKNRIGISAKRHSLIVGYSTQTYHISDQIYYFVLYIPLSV